MALKFKASDAFWEQFYALPAEQKESARDKWKIFKRDPFDPSLKTHKINRLSALMRQTVWAAEIEGNLRVAFCRKGDTIFTIAIGTHDIYG